MRGPETLYVEPTNRCNLSCTTCPRSFFDKEPLRDMTLAQLRTILDQIPSATRIVLHGQGEPLLNPALPDMVAAAKARPKATALFNTNGLLLAPALSDSLIAAGLDELRVSVDMPDPDRYPAVRRGGRLAPVYENVREFIRRRTAAGRTLPAVSFWMTEGRERLAALPRLIEDAASLGVREVYLQRLILLDCGDACNTNALFGQVGDAERRALDRARRTALALGIALWGSGDANPAERALEPDSLHPWKQCRRPFEAAYVTANGNLLPCCLSPFTAAGRLAECVLGNVFERPFQELWEGAAYQAFRTAFLSDSPPISCGRCGTRWSL